MTALEDVYAPAFSPGDIHIDAFHPFLNTFGRARCEVAAALLVLACKDHGDWFAALPQEMYDALKRAVGLKWPWNPVLMHIIDFEGLIAQGFAVFVDDGTVPLRIKFTEQGLRALERWVVRSKAPGEP